MQKENRTRVRSANNHISFALCHLPHLIPPPSSNSQIPNFIVLGFSEFPIFPLRFFNRHCIHLWIWCSKIHHAIAVAPCFRFGNKANPRIIYSAIRYDMMCFLSLPPYFQCWQSRKLILNGFVVKKGAFFGCSCKDSNPGWFTGFQEPWGWWFDVEIIKLGPFVAYLIYILVFIPIFYLILIDFASYWYKSSNLLLILAVNV